MSHRYILSVAALVVFCPAVHAITFAQLALGGGYEATVMLTNKSSFVWSGSFRVRQGADARWSGSWSINSQNFTGYDYATIQLRSKETGKWVFRGDGTTRTGYLEIRGDINSSDLDVAVAYFYNYYSGGVLRNSTGSPESAWDDKMIFPVERSATVDTGYAICPFILDPPFQIKLTLFDNNGNQWDQRTIDFKGQFAEFLSQRFPGLPASFVGHVLVESQYMVALEVLRLETASDGRFLITSTPADDYVP